MALKYRLYASSIHCSVLCCGGGHGTAVARTKTKQFDCTKICKRKPYSYSNQITVEFIVRAYFFCSFFRDSDSDIFTLTMCRILASQQSEFCIRSFAPFSSSSSAVRSIALCVCRQRDEISSTPCTVRHTIFINCPGDCAQNWLSYVYINNMIVWHATNAMAQLRSSEVEERFVNRSEMDTKCKTIDRFEMTKMLNYYRHDKCARITGTQAHRHTAVNRRVEYYTCAAHRAARYSHRFVSPFAHNHRRRLRDKRRRGDKSRHTCDGLCTATAASAAPAASAPAAAIKNIQNICDCTSADAEARHQQNAQEEKKANIGLHNSRFDLERSSGRGGACLRGSGTHLQAASTRSFALHSIRLNKSLNIRNGLVQMFFFFFFFSLRTGSMDSFFFVSFLHRIRASAFRIILYFMNCRARLFLRLSRHRPRT